MIGASSLRRIKVFLSVVRYLGVFIFGGCWGAIFTLYFLGHPPPWGQVLVYSFLGLVLLASSIFAERRIPMDEGDPAAITRPS